MKEKTKHICQVCGKEFYGRANQKNCTVQCGWRKSSNKYYWKNRVSYKRGGYEKRSEGTEEKISY